MGLSGDRPLGGDGWFRNHHGIGALLISFEKRPGGGNSNIPLDLVIAVIMLWGASGQLQTDPFRHANGGLRSVWKVPLMSW